MAPWNRVGQLGTRGARPAPQGTVKRPGAFRLAVPAFLLSLSLTQITGCIGDEASPDLTPPDHMIKAPESQGKYRFGISDTIAIEFSENIDTGSLDLEFSDSAGMQYEVPGPRKAIVFGTRNSYGASHFPVNTPFTLTIRGLQDRWGNGHPDIEQEFIPYAWADRDYLDTTYDFYDTLYNGDAWLDGTPVSDTLLIEGSLDYKQNFGRVDRLDYKVIRVAAPDTVEVSVTTRKDLNVRVMVAGPFRLEGFDAALTAFDFNTAPTTGEGTKLFARDSTAGKGLVSRSWVTDLKDHKRVTGSFDAPALYVIRLGVPEEKEGFYRVGLRIRKF